MADMVKLTINGKEVEAAEGINLIEAAEQAGIHIPNLCYLKGMKGVGACRLCLVELEGSKAPVIACNTKVKEGMKVATETEKLREARRFVIDLILSMHPLDCMTCTKAGVCNLQKYAYDFGIKESSFTRKKFGFPTDEANPCIKRDPDYCILCGRCVRVCKEQGTNVLDFMGRGVGAKVATAIDKPLQESSCTFCGSCVDACPVNALLEADRWRKGREWEYDTISSTCLLCGNGCDITVSIKDGRVQKINAGAMEGSAEHYICAYGRFGFDCIEADTRLTSPMVRVNGKLKETTWKEAVALAAEKLKGAGGDAGFISVAGIENEDALALKRLASEVVKTKNVATTMSLYGDAGAFINSQTADLDKADLIILVGLSPSQWDRVLPALDAVIRRRVERGAKLIVINSADTRISEVASVSIRGDEANALMAIAKAALENKGVANPLKGMIAAAVKDARVSDDAAKAAELFAAAASPVVLASPALFDAASNLSLLKGSAVAVPLESNAKGIALMGLAGEGKSYKEMASQGATVLYAVGEVPLHRRPDAGFLIVQNSHLSELAKEADLVLPSAVFLESEGTVVDYMGRLKYLPKVIEPQGEAKPHREIFAEIAKAMGGKLKKPTEAEVKKLAKLKVKPALRPFAKKEGFDVSPEEIVESINASVINGSRLLWLKETEKAIAAGRRF